MAARSPGGEQDGERRRLIWLLCSYKALDCADLTDMLSLDIIYQGHDLQQAVRLQAKCVCCRNNGPALPTQKRSGHVRARNLQEKGDEVSGWTISSSMSHGMPAQESDARLHFRDSKSL